MEGLRRNSTSFLIASVCLADISLQLLVLFQHQGLVNWYIYWNLIQGHLLEWIVSLVSRLSCIIFLSQKQHSLIEAETNGRHFADDIFNSIFLNENVWTPIKISLKFVPKGLINNIRALDQIMAWRRPGAKPLSEPMMVTLLMHICVTQPQWVNSSPPSAAYTTQIIENGANSVTRRSNFKLVQNTRNTVYVQEYEFPHMCLLLFYDVAL